jgi:hypothetical protein
MKPLEKEYAKYMGRYIDAVESEDLVAELIKTGDNLVAFFEKMPSKTWNYSYDIDKWTPLDILLHIMDAERVFAYRALRFSRGDTTNLNGFDHDDYVAAAQATGRDGKSLLAEFKAVRASTVSLFHNMKEADLLKVGMANNNISSCRALGFLIVGHQMHHVKVVQERYLNNLPD